MKMRKAISLMLLVILVIGALTGCGSNTHKVEAAENTNALIVVGNHAGSLVPVYSTCESAVMGACKAEGNIGVIIADGSPFLASGEVIDIPKQQDNLSTSKIKSIYTSQTEQIMMLMKTTYAQTEEVDLLKALSLCSREAHSSGFSKGKTEIYVYDPGVSTLGLNMTAMDLEYVSADSVVSCLEERNMIPDLSGMGTIYWYGLGDTDYEISNAQREGIKSIWTAIIEDGGAQVQFCTDPSTTKFDVDLPYVSELAVTIDPINPDSGKPEKIEEIDEKVIQFTEEEIGFEPGKATFADSDKAKITLSTILDFLKEHDDISILVAGTTACWGDDKYQSSLSYDRAETIKQYFVSEGIDERRLTTIGLGSSSGFYKPDKKPDGSLDELVAARNRSIVIMDITSEKAVQILSGEFKRGEVYE